MNETKRIIVTGCTSGLGLMTAEVLSQRGYNLILAGRNLDRIRSKFRSDDYFLELDLSNLEELQGVFSKLDVPVDGVVCAGGILETKLIRFADIKLFESMMRTNFLSNTIIISSLLKRKLLKNPSSIVFVTSISVDHADLGNAAYSASKGALRSFSRVLALEGARSGIRSNCVEPGFIPTNLTKNTPLSKTVWENEKSKYPLGFGDPLDAANIIEFLVSDKSKWMTGQNIRFDGGLSLQ